MRRKLRRWRAYAVIVTGVVTLAGTAALAAAPAQASTVRASTAGHASAPTVKTAHPKPKAQTSPKSAEAHYTDAGCNAANLKKNYAQCFAVVCATVSGHSAPRSIQLLMIAICAGSRGLPPMGIRAWSPIPAMR